MVKRAAVREVSLYPGSTLGEPSLPSTAYRQMILSATLEGGSCADAVREQGDLSRARMLLEESLALSRGKEHAWGIARTLASLASVACEEGEYARTSMLYEESLELARRMGMNHTILPCLEGLSRVALAQGRMERAAWLCGASAALHEDMGWVLSPAKRGEHDRTVAAARGALGEEAFAAAWARSHALPLEEIIGDTLLVNGA
jgi:hypothetical protein